MQQKKKVRVVCSSPCAIDSKYQTPWEDVWVMVNDRRKALSFGPCICSRSDLAGSIQEEKEVLKRHPELGDEQLINLEEIERRLEKEDAVICENGAADIPDIYVKEDKLSKASIEKTVCFSLPVEAAGNDVHFCLKKEACHAIGLR
jgi:hypothetical protein